MSYLGNLTGDEWSQYSNDAGQVFYVDSVTGQSQFEIPAGWEDHRQVGTSGWLFYLDSLLTHFLAYAQDNWNYDAMYQYWLVPCYEIANLFGLT
jgi:hypothetical protein